MAAKLLALVGKPASLHSPALAAAWAEPSAPARSPHARLLAVGAMPTMPVGYEDDEDDEDFDDDSFGDDEDFGEGDDEAEGDDEDFLDDDEDLDDEDDDEEGNDDEDEDDDL